MTTKLYESYSNETQFKEVDHIIIGSGIGGLTAAVWLAKAGKKVIVLEKHYVPGGFTHSFKRKNGFQWDVGVHYVGNVGKEDYLRFLFDFLTNKKVEWESIGSIYDVVKINGNTYEFTAGKQNQINQLKKYFPNESTAINQYFELIEKSNKAGSAFFFEKTFKPILSLTIGRFLRKSYAKYYKQTTLEVISKLTDNKELIAVLCGQCGNYGLSPSQSSFAAHAMVIGHFLEGGYYPKGGSEQIGLQIIQTLTDFGGKVYTKANVSKIITRKNRVSGVEINGRFIPCKSVISAIGVSNTFNKLLTTENRIKCNFNLKNTPPSTGHVCLYVGLDQSDAALNLPKHNLWLHASNDLDQTINSTQLENAAQNFAYISFPSAKDSGWEKSHPNTATIQALSIGKYEWFKEFEHLPVMKRGEKYDALKQDFENKMLAVLYQEFPQIKGHVVITEVSTPLSTKHFSNYENGEIYGLAHTPQRFDLPILRSETKIKGLRLAGQDITIVGVAGAMLSGLLCATTILKFSTYSLFKNLKKTTEEFKSA